MGFLQALGQIVKPFWKTVSRKRLWMIVIMLFIPLLSHHPWHLFSPAKIAIAQPFGVLGAKKVHPMLPSLDEWEPSQPQDHYFQKISELPLGYLIWSDRPVSIYVGPSHFTDLSRKQAWEDGVQQAIADWQAYFPLEKSEDLNADIVIEQVRPQRTSNGRIRSAQATPKAYCKGDRLSHRFTIQISPSQTSRYIQSATRHELGHTLGIWGHSDNPQDVMYKAQVSQPPQISERDIRTLQKIYEQPTLLGWSNPQYCPTSVPKSPESPSDPQNIQ